MNSQKPGTKKREPFSEETLDVDGDVKESILIQGDGNTIHFDGQKKTRKKRSGKKPQKPTGNYTVAWIGFAAVIIGAVITGAMGWFPFAPAAVSPTAFVTQTETSSPTPTETATFEPTLTSIPVDTATATSLPTATLVPPVAIGEDWSQGCISQLWQAYPPVELDAKGDGCWWEPVYAFSADKGNLYFLSERDGGDAELYGLFMPLPESGSVTFTIRLESLENADLLMGVFPEPNVESDGLLMVIPNGNVERNVVLQKDPKTYVTKQGTVALYQGDGYSLSFTFTTLSVTSKVNPNIFVTNQVSIQKPQKWLFLGYKGLRGAYRIEGSFLNFEINE